MADRTVGWVELKFGSWDACNPLLHALVLPCLSLGAFFAVLVAGAKKEVTVHRVDEDAPRRGFPNPTIRERDRNVPSIVS